MVVEKTSLIKTIAVWISVVIAIRLATLVPIVKNYHTVLTFVLLLYTPILIDLVRKVPSKYLKFDKAKAFDALKWTAVICLIVFPAAFAINHYYQVLAMGFNYKPSGHEQLFGIGLSYLMLAFAEEVFFRGYFLEEFQKRFVPTKTIFGASFGKADIIVAILFSISHSLILGQWWHPLIFFPALVFSWLKNRTGTVWAPTLFHWISNLFSHWVFLHYG